MSFRCALISDVVGSSSLSDVERQRLDRQLLKGFRLFNRDYKPILAGDFGYTVGDEFEAVFESPDLAIRPTLILHCWLASQTGQEGIRVRSALGIGQVFVTNSRQSSRQDGPAFHVARRLIGRLHDDGQVIGISCQGDGSLVYLANSSLKIACRLLDLIINSWSPPQWEAVYWKLLGERPIEIATRLKIAPQNISKRLKNAGYDLLDETILEIESILRHPDLRTAIDPPSAPTTPNPPG